jgi:hypothetical protein
MTREEAFAVWAPDGARWSQWAKPVLFAFLDSTPRLAAALAPAELPAAAPISAPANLSGVPAADGATVVVVDLPGPSGVTAGLDLAERGYRPVPLYNAVPAPGVGALAPHGAVVVDMAEVIQAISDASGPLEQLRLREDAPPAFLLDVRRRIGDVAVIRPGAFDNRSVSLPTDFPSSNLLLSSGVRRVIVVQGDAGQPQADLAHTLRRWQDAGLEVLVLATAASTTEGGAGVGELPRPITVSKPRWYRHLWHGILARFGLRPHPLGGFGGFLPVPSAG